MRAPRETSAAVKQKRSYNGQARGYRFFRRISTGKRASRQCLISWWDADKAGPIRLAATCAVLTKNYEVGLTRLRRQPSLPTSAWDCISCRRPSAGRASALYCDPRRVGGDMLVGLLL